MLWLVPHRELVTFLAMNRSLCYGLNVLYVCRLFCNLLLTYLSVDRLCVLGILKYTLYPTTPNVK